MKATIGRMVVLHNLFSNGSNDQPAMITRVWSDRDTRDGPVAVNLTVFLDAVATPQLRSSVMLFDTAEQAREHCAGRMGMQAAHWPDRV